MSKKSKILIVDDVELNREILKDIIGKQYDIYEATDGMQAIDLISSINFDMVLLDLTMPKADGFEVLEKVNAKENKSCPFLIISADDSPEAINKAYELGCTDYIPRPYVASIVRRRIEIILSLFQNQNEILYELKEANKRHMEALLKVNKEAFYVNRFTLENKNKSKYTLKYDNNELKDIVESFKSGFIGPKHEGYEKITSTFNRHNLMSLYEKGTEKITITHPYVVNQTVRVFNTSASLYKNNYSGNIEGIIYQEDITETYINKRVQDILYKNQFETVLLINLNDNTFSYLKVKDGIDGSKILNKNLDYTKHFNQFINEQYDEIEAENCLKKLNIDNLKKAFSKEKFISFIAKNKNNEKKHFQLTWFLKKRNSILCSIEDITSSDELDLLTGKLNLNGFIRKGKEQINAHPNTKYSILYFDVCDFKAINDIYSYKVANQLLVKIYDYLESSLSPILLARDDADQFVALIESNKVVQKDVITLLQNTIIINNLSISIYGRCGICNMSKEINSLENAIDFARSTSYQIKNIQNSPCKYFNKDDYDEYLKTKEFINNLPLAIKNNEFIVYFQPIYDAKNKSIVSSEALIRWIDKNGNIISPSKFIPVLEENGLITYLDNFVFNKVCDFILERYESNLNIVPISINLSRIDLCNNHFIDLIIQKLSTSKALQEYIRIEITESAYSSLYQNNNFALSKFKELGIIVLLDDFGTGVSSFSTLITESFNILKLDLGFVKKIGINHNSEIAIKSIITMAKEMNLKIIAEGVENEIQVNYLLACDCDYFQGYHFSKPISKADFEDILNKN